jgi:hypothetical protein
MRNWPILLCLGLHFVCGGGCSLSGQSSAKTSTRPSQSAAATKYEAATGPSQSHGPQLFFSDLDSGPKSGNSDISQGQRLGEDGAIVSVWGARLGDLQGSSRVFVNGAEAVRIYYWGNAVAPYSPANLYNNFTKTQMVIFQVSHLSADGPGQVTVEVNGLKSNSLPFEVRAGRIFFVSKSGSDGGGRGTWNKPWKSIPRGINRFRNDLAPGDIVYVRDGVSQTDSEGNDSQGSALNLNSDGRPGKPIALVAYPGARVTLGSPSLEAFETWVTNQNHGSSYWVIAKMVIVGVAQPMPLRTGFRFVGNLVSAPRGDGATGTIGAHGSNIAILGNEITNCGSLASSYLYHTIYVSGFRRESGARLPAESNREIAWNYIHDNQANRAINIYSEGTSSAFIEGHRVHHNVIVNQRGDGILLGFYVTGENWVYENLIIDAGLGPEFQDGGTQQTCMDVRAGVENMPQAGTVLHIYNNTMYRCGWPGAGKNSGALEFVRQGNYQLDFHNNIIWSNQPYMSGYSETPRMDASAASQNLWFGAGHAPAWDTGALNADPEFIDAAGFDLHLKPSSPARHRGVSTGRALVTIDLDGNVVSPDARYDLGAYWTLSEAPSAVH